MSKKINLLLRSLGIKVINKRYQIKCSILDTGVYPISVMIVVQDMLSKNFKIKFFQSPDELNQFIEILST